MESFDQIFKRASERKGGSGQLESLLSQPKSSDQLATIDDSRYLAEFSKKVFQSGFVWRVVEQKWSNFEELFWQFNVDKLVMMPPEMLEQKAQDPKIIRNFRKVRSIIDNAHMIKGVAAKRGSFSSMIAEWPSDDIVGLWLFLKKEGNRLGGNTGPYALRSIGKDTFLLSRDVEAYLRGHKLIEGGLTSLRSLKAIQSCFNEWQLQSGLSLQEISQIIAYGNGDNYV